MTDKIFKANEPFRMAQGTPIYISGTAQQQTCAAIWRLEPRSLLEQNEYCNLSYPQKKATVDHIYHQVSVFLYKRVNIL